MQARPCGTFCNMDPIEIGAIVFPRMDQMDFTGPFEVLSRIPDARFHVLWKDKAPVRDIKGLILTPEMTFAEAPQLDVLVVPGGWGQEQLMDDEAVLSFIRAQAAHATYVFSVCTGALLCGAAGLLKGVRANTHWAAFHLLEYFGAIPTDERVVVDGKHVSAAGVTAGIDGALRLVSCCAATAWPSRSSLPCSTRRSRPSPAGAPKQRRRRCSMRCGQRAVRSRRSGWGRRSAYSVAQAFSLPGLLPRRAAAAKTP